LKVIAFILSAYLVFLIAVPCCSFDNCPEEKTAQTADHENGDEGFGSCSPFFTCTSCSGFTVTASIINAGFIPFAPNNQYPAYIVSLVPDISYDFWQPPKLV
jgi:hypothetical protein